MSEDIATYSAGGRVPSLHRVKFTVMFSGQLNTYIVEQALIVMCPCHAGEFCIL